MRKCGSLTVICGSMYAGKTEELIRRARRALYAKRTVKVFKHATDDRYSPTRVVSHMGIDHEATPVLSSLEIAGMIAEHVDVVCIEEAQFFDMDIVPLCTRLADCGIDVVVAGLDQDFRRQPFGPMPQLLALADEVVKLRAICMKCGADASHTYRSIDGEPAHTNDPIVLVGATETYEARCRVCYEIKGSAKPKRGRFSSS